MMSSNLVLGAAILLQASLIVWGRTTESPLDFQGPVFLSEPPDSLIFGNTKGAKVPCTAFGVPLPSLRWVKDNGVPVQNIPGVLQVLPNNTLHFFAFEAKAFRTDVHSQTYRCLAANDAGAIVSRRMVVKAVLVAEYTEYSLKPNDVWATRGSTAVFRCHINPYFVNDYVNVVSWIQGSKPIATGERVSLLSDGELHIRDIREVDRYTTYRCVARNILTGEEKQSSFAYLHLHDPPVGWSSPTMDDVSRLIKIREGDTVELPCVASSNPLPKYRWQREGEAVAIDNVHLKQMGGNLRVTSARIYDSGHYMCNASNEHGSATAVTQLIVTSPLSATIDPPSPVIDSGMTAVLNCSIHGHPVTSVTWYKNGRELVADDDERVSIQSNTILEITSVTRQDQGMYQCFVENDKGAAQGSSQLLLGSAHPSFIDAFTDQYVKTGHRVLLRCIAAGNPSPEVTWSLDDDVIPEEADIHVSSTTNAVGDVISFLNISSVRIQLGGEYKCVASNSVGRIEHVGRVNVYGVPFVRPMRNITATAGEKLSIRCYVAGHPIENIKWFKDGYQLPRNHLQKVINGTLTIEKVQKYQDYGQYTCVARNGDGQGNSSHVFVSVLEPPKIDKFLFPRRKLGDRVVVSCVVSSGDQPLEIKWTKDGEPIPPDLGITVQNGTYSSMLSIGDVSPRHDGNYTCHAHNAAADVNFTARLDVDVPPRWVIEPQDANVILNGETTLDCLTAGTPEPHVTWRKAEGSTPGNYVPLSYSREEDDVTSGRMQLLSNGTLVIRKALEEDHGYYLCHSINGVGVGLSKVVFLTVHIPARFDAQTKNYTVVKGRSITMNCQAIGDQPLSVTWSFNRKSISTLPSERRSMTTVETSRGKLSHLTLTPAGREDTGFYVCNAKNRYGAGALPMKLTVIEPPEPPINVSLVRAFSRDFTIAWTPPYNGNTPILFYVIEYKNESDAWQGALPNKSVIATSTSATVTNLHPAFTYHVRVSANNSVGQGQPSIQVKVTMEEEAPTGVPREVKIKAIGSEALKITWMPPPIGERNGVIKGYHIGYKETGESQSRFIYITKAVEGDFKPELDIQNLEKFTEYTVHIQAYNDKGRGPLSEDFKVFTLEDVPSQPPQGVQATAINSQSIKVLWSPPPLFTLHGILQGYRVLYKPVRRDEDETDANAVTSSKLEVTLIGLSKFTNFSIQVLAFTRKGEGVRSEPIYIRTQEDVPERPANIKTLPVNSSCILVSWKPPLHSNGILTKYNVYIKNSTDYEDTVEVVADKTSLYICGLRVNEPRECRVSASTRIGEGETTHSSTASPLKKVSARISSFSDVLTVPWHHPVVFPCHAVGDPRPKVTWRIRGEPLVPNTTVEVLTNGSLFFHGVMGSDAANYTCQAENVYGADNINYALSVQVSDKVGLPPKAPKISIAATTVSTIQVNWRSGSNGGSPIRGFWLHYKKEHEMWKSVRLGAYNRSYTANGLLCGTWYRFKLLAFNRFGNSSESETLLVKTNGSTPIMPPQSMLLRTTNTTSIDLDMSMWNTSGCPIKYFSVKYKVWGDEVWIDVANNINKNTTIFTVLDLHPATWYVMVVTAHSDSGSTESELKFATLNYHGSTIMPIFIARRMEEHFYQKAYVIIPLCAGIVGVCVLVVAILLYFKRRRDLQHIKENNSNLRRDITAETSLMNDLDKRLNLDLDSSSGHSEQFGKRNVNLLLSLQSDDTFDNLNGNSQSWLINDSSKTNSDNGSFGRSDDDGNINPYATFNQLKQVIAEKHDPLHDCHELPEFDNISLEKAQAQKCMSPPSEPYVPFFKTNGTCCPDPHPPLEPIRDQEHKGPGYDNQGMMLSPRKYASADQIHALFSQGPPRPHSSYGKSKSGSHGSSDEKGSQRHSVISSITTVSSSRDELLEALENARKNPPPPVVYESPPDSSSGPTDSSVATEPGIVQFTQSPPRPNEQRQAACELPSYETVERQKRAAAKKKDAVSDTTDQEAGEMPRETFHPRRTRGRHRGKQRGQISKRQVVPALVPRTHSRTSTTSSEEVTYTFGAVATGRESPTCGSPHDHCRPLRKEAKRYKDSDYGLLRKTTGRTTPHARSRYDTALQTPGTDEHRPLVMSLAGQSMASPAEEEEDAVSLLDRYYRPVQDDAPKETEQKKKGDKGYTDNYTVV